MNMKNNYVGELQEFEVSHGGQNPIYTKRGVTANHKDPLWVATVILSDGASYVSSASYAKYGHAKNDAAYVALCHERTTSRKDASEKPEVPLSSSEIQTESFDVEYVVLISVPLRRIVEDVLATKPNRSLRMVWVYGIADFDRICAFASIMRALDISFTHNPQSNVSRVFC